MKPAAIEPPAWVGVFGGGQLGRMFAEAAQPLGYRVAVYADEADSPAAQVADRVQVGDYADADQMEAFARGVQALTFEFENVSAEAAYRALDHTVVRPHPRILEAVQQRFREKELLTGHGFETAPYRLVSDRAELDTALQELNGGVFKTVTSGYDGHGQVGVENGSGRDEAAVLLEQGPGIVEGWIDFACELSVVVARNPAGDRITYGPFRNDHADHILDVSVTPAEIPPDTEREAVEIALEIAQKLELEGVLCVELFWTTDGRLLINELAPRPHNSGHLTIEANASSQFDQQIRALCALPLGSTEKKAPAAAMANLLGDLWLDVRVDPDAAGRRAFLHLYGKSEPRRRRKMGHVTALGETPAEARRLALAARDAFAGGVSESRNGERRDPTFA